MKDSAGLLASLLVVVSGCRPQQVETRSLDPGEAVWTPVALPAPRHGHRIELVDGGLLSFGGFGDSSAPDRETRQTWWLTRGAKEWQRRADMIAGRAFFASAVVDGAVYAVGDGVERYDAAADRWIAVAPAGNLPSSHFAAAAIGRALYVIGGFSTGHPGMYAVDLASGEEREIPAPPGFGPGDHFHFARILGGRLHVIGGLDGESFEPKTEHWVLTDEGWKADAPPPEGVWAKFAVQADFDGKLYLFGDFGGLCFDPETSAWTPRAKLPFMMAMPQAVAIEGSIWVIGGVPVDGERGPILLRYDIGADAWR